MLTDLLLSRDPFHDLDDLLRRLDVAFDRGLDGQHGLVHAGRRLPQFHVSDEHDAVVLTADVPGLRPEQLSITHEGDVLTVRGAFEDEVDEGWNRLRSERARWRFERSFRFARPVDIDRLEARLQDGVLRITAPKKAPSSVTITVEEA